MKRKSIMNLLHSKLSLERGEDKVVPLDLQKLQYLKLPVVLAAIQEYKLSLQLKCRQLF